MTALAGVLEDYCRVYEDLLSLARRKREILLAGRPQDLEPVVQAEEALLSRLGRLDDALEEAQRALPGSRAGDGGSDPLAGLEPGRHQELEALVARLRSTLDELRQVAEENVSLLQGALQFVQFSIGLLERSSAGVTYAASGQVARGRAPLVDRRA